MPSSTTPKKTVLKGDPLRKEGTAGAAGIIPGHLVNRNAAGNFVVHGTAAAVATASFAAEQDFLGSDIDTAYANGDRIQVNYFRSGDEVYAFLDAGESATPAIYLESAGNGALQALTTGVAVARAIESVNNSAGGAPVRIKVEVL
jgi:hypothetical protein